MVLLFRYEVDETSPEDSIIDAMFGKEGEQIYKYQILSKPIQQRKVATKPVESVPTKTPVETA